MNIYPAGSARRRTEILTLVNSQPVRSQGELQQLLRRRGFTVAQPTLSRDLRDLGLARTPMGYVAQPERSAFLSGARREETLDRAIGKSVLAVQVAGALVVVKTPPGDAHPVARSLDEASMPDVVGTIAGDDTVFVATPNPAAAFRVKRRLLGPLTSAGLRRRAQA